MVPVTWSGAARRLDRGDDAVGLQLDGERRGHALGHLPAACCAGGAIATSTLSCGCRTGASESSCSNGRGVGTQPPAQQAEQRRSGTLIT